MAVRYRASASAILVRLVTAACEVKELLAGGGEELRMARLSLGLAGVFVALELRCEPAYFVSRRVLRLSLLVTCNLYLYLVPCTLYL